MRRRKLLIQHPHAAEWIDQLQPRQARALGHQHKIDDALTKDIERLRTDLLMLPEVRQLAGDPDGQEVQP